MEYEYIDMMGKKNPRHHKSENTDRMAMNGQLSLCSETEATKSNKDEKRR